MPYLVFTLENGILNSWRVGQACFNDCSMINLDVYHFNLTLTTLSNKLWRIRGILEITENYDLTLNKSGYH